MALFTKRYHEPGTLPGTLVETVYEAPLRIMLVEFTDESFEERIIDSPTECVSPEECHEYLDSPSKTWIHVQGCVTPDALLDRPDEAVLGRIHHLRRELLLRRLIWPQSEVLRQLLHGDCGYIEDRTKLFLRDCHDHALHILELLESYREMTAVMLEAYLSSASNRLNEAMRVLSVIATIFMPLTFIVGVYGMNFSVNETSRWAMPELRWDYGYPAVWFLMIAVFAGMLVYFKRRKWF